MTTSTRGKKTTAPVSGSSSKTSANKKSKTAADPPTVLPKGIQEEAAAAPPKIVKQKKLPRTPAVPSPEEINAEAVAAAAAVATAVEATVPTGEMDERGRVNYYGNKWGFRYNCPACMAQGKEEPFHVFLDERFKPPLTESSSQDGMLSVRDDAPWTRAFKNKKTDMRLHYKDKHNDIPEYAYPMAFIEIKQIETRKYMEGKTAAEASTV